MTEYGFSLSRDYFVGECGYMEVCPDIKKLREGEANRKVDEDLADQYHELCSVGGRCLIKKSLEEKIK